MKDLKVHFKKLNEAGKGLAISVGAREADERTLILKIDGYIETQNAPLFQDAFLSLIGELSDVTAIVLDLTGLSYLSSMGIGALVTIRKKTEESGHRLLLYGVSKKVWNIIDQLGFGDAFELTKSLDGREEGPESRPEGFPLVVSCPQCGKKLRASKPGTYRCPDCRIKISVEAHR
jgi:anti-sigma B factor antagonist